MNSIRHFGGKDENVPVNASVDRLKENELNHFKIKIYPKGGHAIRDVHTNKVSEAFLPDLVKFIKAVKQYFISGIPGRKRILSEVTRNKI